MKDAPKKSSMTRWMVGLGIVGFITVAIAAGDAEPKREPPSHIVDLISATNAKKDLDIDCLWQDDGGKSEVCWQYRAEAEVIVEKIEQYVDITSITDATVWLLLGK